MLKLLGYRLVKLDKDQRTNEEKMIDCAEELSRLWQEQQKVDKTIAPWIDWQEKTVEICERSFRVAKKEKS